MLATHNASCSTRMVGDMKYLDSKPFGVSQYGAKLWPKCEATKDGVRCQLEMGHKERRHHAVDVSGVEHEWPCNEAGT